MTAQKVLYPSEGRVIYRSLVLSVFERDDDFEFRLLGATARLGRRQAAELAERILSRSRRQVGPSEVKEADRALDGKRPSSCS